jgi:RNA polymerase sigma-70 factor (ECF subfamily)
MSPPDSEGSKAAQFRTTSWTVIARAGQWDSPEARQSLAELCAAYWYPIYAYLRRRGHSPHEAEDITQGFFADLLARDSLKALDPAQGKFRAFLLAALGNFLANRRAWHRRQKRGGTIPHFSLDLHGAEDRYAHEPVHQATPERLFERRWALTLLAQVLDRLESEVNRDARGPLFERLKPALMGASDGPTYSEIGRALGMSEGAVRVAAHRLRKRYRALLQEEIARTLSDSEGCDEEIGALFQALGG